MKPPDSKVAPGTSREPTHRQDCSECRDLDARECGALRVRDPHTGQCFRDYSELTDVAVLRERHASYCKFPRAVRVSELIPASPEAEAEAEAEGANRAEPLPGPRTR